jgi:hypothetical protein
VARFFAWGSQKEAISKMLSGPGMGLLVKNLEFERRIE